MADLRSITTLDIRRHNAKTSEGETCHVMPKTIILFELS